MKAYHPGACGPGLCHSLLPTEQPVVCWSHPQEKPIHAPAAHRSPLREGLQALWCPPVTVQPP